MTTISYALLAAASLLLWRKVEWSWVLLVAALVLGIIVFVGDVDFATNLGVQL